MHNWPTWFVGVMFAILGVGGLFIAARAEDSFMYNVGLIFFVCSVLFDFRLIKSVYDEAERA